MCARKLLARRDRVLAAIMARHGACGLAADQHADPFAALTRAIVSQQLSTKAAATIYKRFRALFPEARVPTPQDVLDVPEGVLESAGLSRQKSAYLRDLSRKVLDGDVPLDRLPSMDDEQVIATLVRVKGIGRWSAEMFLIFRLHRPDVLPVDDLGILKAVKTAYGLRKLPSGERLRRLGEAWRPYRSIACWYLWASLDNKPTGSSRRSVALQPSTTSR